MKISLKLSILTLLLVFLAVELAACGSKDAAQPASSSASGSASSSAGASAGTSSTAAPAKSTAAAAPVEVKAEASNFQWKLDKTEFTVGTPIKFNVSVTQGMHGFSIVGTDVKIPQIAQGETKDVTWTPDKPGEYTIKCIFMCGSGHSTMMTKITVK